MKKEWGADLKKGGAKEKTAYRTKIECGAVVNNEGRRSTPSSSSSSRKNTNNNIITSKS